MPSPSRSDGPVNPARSENRTVTSRRLPPGSARMPSARSERTGSVGNDDRAAGRVDIGDVAAAAVGGLRDVDPAGLAPSLRLVEPGLAEDREACAGPWTGALARRIAPDLRDAADAAVGVAPEQPRVVLRHLLQDENVAVLRDMDQPGQRRRRPGR